jgi:orotate phosphoribosyltransferase
MARVNKVEGPIESGQTAVMMEDVVTTGGSSLKAIEHARAFGLKVDRIIAIVDRGENSAEIFDAVGVKFTSLLHVKDLGV